MRILSILVAALTLVGCLTAPQQATQSIGPAGGTLTSSDGSVVLTIPAGALPTATLLSIESTSSLTLPSGDKVLGSAWALLPAGTSLAMAGQLAVTLPASQLSGALAVQLFAGQAGGAAQALPSTQSGSTFTASIATFEVIELGGNQQTAISTSGGYGGPSGATGLNGAFGTTGGVTGGVGVGGSTGTIGCSGPGTGFTVGGTGSAQCSILNGCQTVTCVGATCTCYENNQPGAQVDAGPEPVNCSGAWTACGFQTTSGGGINGAVASGSTGPTGSTGTSGNGSATAASTGTSGTSGACASSCDCAALGCGAVGLLCNPNSCACVKPQSGCDCAAQNCPQPAMICDVNLCACVCAP